MVKKTAKKRVKAKAKKAGARAEAIMLKNYMEDMAKRNMEEQLECRDDLCKCDRCKMDILAFSLNQLPPKYVVTDRGHIYTKLQEMEYQFNADITREVLKAVEFIKVHKRHQ